MKRVLIIVENLPVPFDRRVWQEATTLKATGYGVSVICPIGKGYEARYECIDGIHVYRHSLALEADGVLGYLLEYGWALASEWWLALSGILSVVFGVVLMIAPAAGALALVVWIGAFAIALGALLIGLALRLRSWQVEPPRRMARAA